MGENEGEDRVGGLRRPGGGLEERPAFIGGEVLATTGVDELKIADQARHFVKRSARLRPYLGLRPGVPEPENSRDRALQELRGEPEM